MPGAIDVLEKNVAAAAGLIANLRDAVERLTHELETKCAEAEARAAQASLPAPDPALVDELQRLRAERVVIRDSIRRLLREIDRVSW